jgi:Uncharacterized protein conserved in bacteria (DUF2325)
VNGLMPINTIYNDFEERDEFIEKLEEFMENIYDEEGGINEDFDPFLFQAIERDVKMFWKENRYKPTDLINLMFIYEVIQESKMKYIEHIYNLCNIKIMTKDRKRGKRAIFERLLRKYHKENVRKTLNGLLETFLRDQIKICQTLDDVENRQEILSELIGNIGMLPVLWIAEEVLKNKELLEEIKALDPKRYVVSLAQVAMFYIDVDFQKVMEHPELLNSEERLEKAKKTQKRIQKKLIKKEKETSYLKQEINSLKQEKKKLEAEVYDLYQSALKEIEQLKQENEQMQEYFMDIINNLNEQILDLQQENADLRQGKLEEINEFDLKGKTIAVIGGSKERHFREIIESYNGKIIFVSETDFNKIEGAVSKADAVFFLKEVVGHHFFREAYPLAKKYKIPFIFVNSIGVSSFKRELKRLIS